MESRSICCKAIPCSRISAGRNGPDRRIWVIAAVGSALAVSGCERSEASSTTYAGVGGLGSAMVTAVAGTAPVPPGGPETCPEGPCNYQTQSGCGEGELCHPQLTDAGVEPGCQEAGDKGNAEACEWGECQPGLFCAAGTCRTLCCGRDWSACPENESCRAELVVDDPTTLDSNPVGAYACIPVNDCRLFGDACPSGQACQIVDNRGSVACGPTGDAEFDDPCDSQRLCSAGFICLLQTQGDAGVGAAGSASAASGGCRRLCSLSHDAGAASCPAAEGRSGTAQNGAGCSAGLSPRESRPDLP